MALQRGFSAVAPGLRNLAASLDAFGTSLIASDPSNLSGQSVTRLPEEAPKTINHHGFVAYGAEVGGKVSLDDGSSIWYHASLTGDISVGKNSCFLDHAVIMAPRQIGNNVIVGPSAKLYNCSLEDGAVIGMGTVVQEGSVVKEGAMVAPGSVVSANTIIQSGQIWAGEPATFVRDLTPEEIAANIGVAQEYAALAKEHAKESAKTTHEVELEQATYQDQLHRDPNTAYNPNPNHNPERRGLVYNDKPLQ